MSSPLDSRTEINLPNAITEAANFEIWFEHFDNGGPEILSGAFELALTSDEKGTKPVVKYSTGSGLEIDGNKLIWKRDKTGNTLKAGAYYYTITQTILTDVYAVYFGSVSVNVNNNK